MMIWRLLLVVPVLLGAQPACADDGTPDGIHAFNTGIAIKRLIHWPVEPMYERDLILIEGEDKGFFIVGPGSTYVPNVENFGLVPVSDIENSLNELPENALPDALAMAPAYGSRSKITKAWLDQPTERYGHGVLGDAVEAGGFSLEARGGKVFSYTLPEDSVFEDRYPRFGDVDGDGEEDIVIVRSYLRAGAALSVWKFDGHSIKPLAESEPIGRPNRWLSPIGVADFDGDGANEIAVVTTPHLNGVLTLYGLHDGRLEVETAVFDYSTHKIGSRIVSSSAVMKLPDGRVFIALPDLTHKRLKFVSFWGGEFKVWASLPTSLELDGFMLAVDLDGDSAEELVVSFANGVVILIEGRMIPAP